MRWGVRPLVAAMLGLALAGCREHRPALDGSSPDDTALLNNAAAMLDTSSNGADVADTNDAGSP